MSSKQTDSGSSAGQGRTPAEQQGKTGIVVVTHADFGKQLMEAAAFILGPQDNCLTIAVDASSEVETTVAALRESIARVDEGDGVLVLTDMFGGTPTNLSLSLLRESNIEVITGVNLPMLLKALTSRHLRPADLAAEAKRAGVQGIVVAGEVLRQKMADG